MNKTRFLTAVAALLACSISMASEMRYRLAGIVTPENGRTLAIIEVPEGEQLLVRAGDLIEGGRVAEITANTVRLDLSQGEVVLRLAATDKREINLAAYRQEELMDAAPKPVATNVLRKISQLAASANERKPEELASEVGGYLGLPAGSRIMAIDDQTVESPAEAVQKIAADIDSKTGDNGGSNVEGSQPVGFQFVISVAGPEGKQRIYVFANEDGNVTFQRVVEN